MTWHVRYEEDKTRGAKQCLFKAWCLSGLDFCMRPQRLSGRKERYSCGPASTCTAQEVCACVLESNCTHPALSKHQNKLCVACSQIIIEPYIFTIAPACRLQCCCRAAALYSSSQLCLQIQPLQVIHYFFCLTATCASRTTCHVGFLQKFSFTWLWLSYSALCAVYSSAV